MSGNTIAPGRRGRSCIICAVMPRADRSNSKAKSFRHMPTDVPDWEQKLTVLSFKRRRPNIPAPLLVVGKEKQDLCHTCYGDGCFWQREVLAGRIPRYPPAKDQKSQDSAAKHGVSICIAPNVVDAIQKLPEGSFELGQSAVIVHPTKAPILILQDPFGSDLADLLALKQQQAIRQNPTRGYKRVGKGQTGIGVSCGHRWCAQDGYQEHSSIRPDADGKSPLLKALYLDIATSVHDKIYAACPGEVLQHNPKPAPGVVVCLSDGSRGVPFSAISLTEDGSFEQHLDKQDTGNSFIWFVYTGDQMARGWFYFSGVNIKVQCWHGIGFVFDADKHEHGSTSDGFLDSYRAKGSYKYGGALYMNKRAQLESIKEAQELQVKVLPRRFERAEEGRERQKRVCATRDLRKRKSVEGEHNAAMGVAEATRKKRKGSLLRDTGK